MGGEGVKVYRSISRMVYNKHVAWPRGQQEPKRMHRRGRRCTGTLRTHQKLHSVARRRRSASQGAEEVLARTLANIDPNMNVFALGINFYHFYTAKKRKPVKEFLQS